MYFTNILYLIIRDKFYVGSAADLEVRLQKNNSNHSGFTGHTGDWEIV